MTVNIQRLGNIHQNENTLTSIRFTHIISKKNSEQIGNTRDPFCTEFGEPGDTGEFDNSGYSGDSSDSCESGNLCNFY